MADTVTGFVRFAHFLKQLGLGAVDLSATNTFYAILHKSGTNLSTDNQISTLTSITNTTAGAAGTAIRSLNNPAFSAISAAPTSSFSFNSDAITWTASATMTVRFVVFYQSLAAGSGLPMGYVELVSADTEIVAGNTITLTPNSRWFKLSG